MKVHCLLNMPITLFRGNGMTIEIAMWEAIGF